jgi:hypothetical protein
MKENLKAELGWLEHWKVLFNPEKTDCMNFPRK